MIATPADGATVERVLAEAAVDTRMPDPGWTGWAQVLAERILQWLTGVGKPMKAALAGYAGTASVLAIGLAIALGVVLVFMIVRALRRPDREGGAWGAHVHVSRADADVRRDARRWREELERRLESGAVAAALEALWWWFACAATGRDDLERSTTSRELVRRAGRAELVEPARQLDVWLYGPRRPAVTDLRGLVRRLEQVLV